MKPNKTDTGTCALFKKANLQRSEGLELHRPFHLLALSANTEKTLKKLAARFENYFVEHPTVPLQDVCFTTNTGRTHFYYRLALIAASTEEMREKLASYRSVGKSPGLWSGKSDTRPGIAFLFTGQGSQYVSMGAGLFKTQPIFRDALEQCDQFLRERLEQPLLSVIYPDAAKASILNQASYAQSALFALEYALAQLWYSWGIEPDVVMGHSLGEYVAACIAGVFSLEDALTLVSERGRLMQALPETGEMAAIFADEQQVTSALAPYPEELSIAAINGPREVVVSGRGKALRALVDYLQHRGIRSRHLKVSHAFHSPLMKPMLNAFEQCAATLMYSTPRIELISNLTGRPLGKDTTIDAGYWHRHVREPVRFADGLSSLQKSGRRVLLEIGPQPILSGLVRRCWPDASGLRLSSLRKGRDEWEQMLSSLAALYVGGVEVNWRGFDGPYNCEKVALPT